MTTITEDMIRKRAEHNNCELSTLEEVSLHQQDIIKIEYIDKWCRELKILYLQSNLIPQIENVRRLKKVEYINLALNNIERIENLEGCESLRKLDLTVNHIRELTSIECLKDLINFREMYLTGNPCCDFECYRDYVVATLPQLQSLDGAEVHKSERIQALQNYQEIRRTIIDQQRVALKEREKQKREYAQKQKEKADKKKQELEKVKNPGLEEKCSANNEEDAGTDRTKENRDCPQANNEEEPEEDKITEHERRRKEEEEEEKQYWEEKSDFTPESRLEVHQHMQEQKRKENKEEVKPKKERRLFYDDGRAFNVNEPKVQFTLDEDEVSHRYLLDIALWKHLDTSLVDADVQPRHVRVLIKGKIFQLHLDREVLPDRCTAQRSQTTGHLLITMPKVGEKLVISRPSTKKGELKVTPPKTSKGDDKKSAARREFLEVDPGARAAPDVTSIVQQAVGSGATNPGPLESRSRLPERTNSPDFVDDPDVPPLL